MLTLAVMMGVSLWLLERLAFAILLLWAWGVAESLAEDVQRELERTWQAAVTWKNALI